MNIKSPKSISEKSTKSSPLFILSPSAEEAIPSIPIESFTTLNLSLGSMSSPKVFENSDKQNLLEVNLDKTTTKARHSKAFSFGGNGTNLLNWLETVKLEFLYEPLMIGGYDDIDQMIAQMMNVLPITEEMLESIGIEKPGYRKRLLAALDEEIGPVRSYRKLHRHTQSTPLRCCMVSAPNNLAFLSAPNLEQWLIAMDLGCYLQNFIKSGYDDLEHLLGLMNSKWPIGEKELIDELEIAKQAHRYKILARLKRDCLGFDSMKIQNLREMHKEDIFIDGSANNSACELCRII